MKKNALIYLGLTGGIFAVASTFLFTSGNETPFFSLSMAPLNGPVYKHYNAIAATDNEHGCSEFWVSCSDFSYVLEQPTEGSIIEGGNITDNPSFDWDSMDYFDGRFIPSINQQKAWGMIPVKNNNKVTYGLYPQTYVSDTDTIAALEALPSSSIDEKTGYYYYNGNFYQNCLGDKCDNDNHFADGTKVVNGTKYWFICEPISWVIMTNVDSTYQVYSEKLIHAGIEWAYSNTNVYEQSQVREWLNGIGSHISDGFLQTALYPELNLLQNMSLSLDDGSATLNDKVRLLTKGEAKDTTYFVDDNARMRSTITDWSAAHHACFKNGSTMYGRWWLCEANTDTTTNAWGVGLDGAVGNGGPKTGNGSKDRCERPVITLTID